MIESAGDWISTIEMITSMGSLGILVAISATLFWYILKKDKEHREDQGNWQSLLNQRQSQILQVVKDNNQAVQELTIAVNSLEKIITLQVNRGS